MKSDLRSGVGASVPSSFSSGVGFSNFVLRVWGIAHSLARSLAFAYAAANAGFSGLPGFSGRYYVVLMDVKSEATPKRRVKRRRRRCSFHQLHDSRSLVYADLYVFSSLFLFANK